MAARSLPLTAFASVFVVAVVVLSATLVVPVGAADDVEPVPFGDTFTLGLTDETVRQTEAKGLSIPRVEVYYSAYEYVVGFNSVGSYVAEQGRTGHEQRFGQPVAAFVSDYAGANASLTEDGYLTAEGEIDFAPAEETVIVVDSRASLPSGPVAVPFSDRDDAAAFVDAYDEYVAAAEETLAGVTTEVPEARTTENAVAERRRVLDRVEELCDRIAGELHRFEGGDYGTYAERIDGLRWELNWDRDGVSYLRVGGSDGVYLVSQYQPPAASDVRQFVPKFPAFVDAYNEHVADLEATLEPVEL